MAATRPRRPIFDDELIATATEALDVGIQEHQRQGVVRELGFRAWANLVPEPRGPLDFNRFRFQLPLYGDRATTDRDLVIKKSTQLGVSTWLLRWALFWADVRGKTALYVFPTDRTLNAFSTERIGPLLRTGYLSTRVSRMANSRELRHIGLGWLYARGAKEAINLESIAADVLALDEYDSLDAGNLGVAEQRVTGPMSEGLIRRVGVPSVPGFGISKLYETTTQHVWMVKCGCGEHQPLLGSETYRDNVDEDSARLVCRKCRRPVDVISGEWVATYPDRETLGYWLTKFIVPGGDLRRVIANHHKTGAADRQNHFNRDLGEEYAPAEGRLSRSALMACTRPGEIHLVDSVATHELVSMGVDVASARALNYRISEHLDEYRKKSLAIGTLEWPDWPDELAPEMVRKIIDGLGGLMVRFGVHMAAIDHLPEGRISRAFAAAFPGRVYLVAYNTAARPKTIWSVDEDEALATVHRTTVIDATLDAFREQRNLLPAEDELPEGYVEHMGNLIRITERDERDQITQFYRSTGPDDYAQAEIYDLMATELYHRRRGIAAVEQAQRVPEPTRDPDEGASVLDQDFEPSLDEGDYDPGKDWQ